VAPSPSSDRAMKANITDGSGHMTWPRASAAIGAGRGGAETMCKWNTTANRSAPSASGSGIA